jgi:nicotinamide riboside kinase
VIRIGLLGGECTGKTTLAEDVAQSLNGLVAPEYLRDFVRDFGRLPQVDDQEGIFLTQQVTVHTVSRAAAHSQVPLVIADPLPLMTAVYSLVYFDSKELITPGLSDAASYDLIVCCTRTDEWTPDGLQRDGLMRQEQAQAVIHDTVVPLLTARGHAVIVVSGDRSERTAAVNAAIGDLDITSH